MNLYNSWMSIKFTLLPKGQPAWQPCLPALRSRLTSSQAFARNRYIPAPPYPPLLCYPLLSFLFPGTYEQYLSTHRRREREEEGRRRGKGGKVSSLHSPFLWKRRVGASDPLGATLGKSFASSVPSPRLPSYLPAASGQKEKEKKRGRNRIKMKGAQAAKLKLNCREQGRHIDFPPERAKLIMIAKWPKFSSCFPVSEAISLFLRAN